MNDTNTGTTEDTETEVGEKSADWWAGYAQAYREIWADHRAAEDAAYLAGVMAILRKLAPAAVDADEIEGPAR